MDSAKVYHALVENTFHVRQQKCQKKSVDLYVLRLHWTVSFDLDTKIFCGVFYLREAILRVSKIQKKTQVNFNIIHAILKSTILFFVNSELGARWHNSKIVGTIF